MIRFQQGRPAQANEPQGFSAVRACDGVLSLLSELDLAAIQRVALGKIGPKQFESCLLEHAKRRRQYLQIRRWALKWEERKYGLVRAEVAPNAEQFQSMDPSRLHGETARKGAGQREVGRLAN